MLPLITMCLFYSIVLGTYERDFDIGEVGPAWKFSRSLRNPDQDGDKKGKDHKKRSPLFNETPKEKAQREEALAGSSLVGTFSVDPYHHLEDGVTKSIELKTLKKSAYDNAFNDPSWKKQWYMHDYRKKNGPVMDLNIVPVHRLGYTVEGVRVAIIDTGVEMEHPDLKENLDMDLQYSVSDDAKNGNPHKHVWQSNLPNHGTKSAGIIAMVANNSVCGAGMAYKAKIVAINSEKLIDTGYYKAKALAYAVDKVDIYSNSWGPNDSGLNLYSINKHHKMAIDMGIQKGRGGLGAIYTFAGGNGRREGDDNCSADEIVNYLYTIGVGGADQMGKRSGFAEACTAIYVTAYPGGFDTEDVVTTSVSGVMDCVDHYTGTSAATPQVSAVIALILQANKELTYRDVMHVITMGAEVAPLADNDSWYVNGAGFWVSNKFGFGLMNGLNMVRWARDWVNVPAKADSCWLTFNIPEDMKFKIDEPAHLSQWTDACQKSYVPNKCVYFLEQVMLTSSVEHRYRGALSITLTSPSGTKSEVLSPWKRDTKQRGLSEWVSKSVHNWGENPRGEWKIVVSSQFERQGLSKAWENMYQTFIKPLMFRMPDYEETGTVHKLELRFHGTTEKPDHHKRGFVPRTYAAFRTADGKTSDPLTSKQRIDGGLSDHHLHPSQIS